MPIQSSSPTKQTFELDVGNGISPQKIRVTVEAESNKENYYASYAGEEASSPSPSRAATRRRNMRTTTTTIPLKGLSDSDDDSVVTPPKRGRGRPRKSTDTPVPSKPKARNATPGKKSPVRRRAFGDLVDGDNEEDWDFAIGKSIEVGRGKGRSNSRSAKPVSRNKATPAATVGSLSYLPAMSMATKKGTRKSLMPEEVPILEDNIENPTHTELPVEEENAYDEAPLRALEPNTVGSHSEYSTIRSTTTAFGEDITVPKFNLDRTPVIGGWSSPIVSTLPTRFGDRIQSHQRSSPLVHRQAEQAPRSSSPVVHRPDIGDDFYQHDGETNYDDEAEDGLGDLEEFDTILESEGFSMISVDSVPSLREHLSSPLVQSKPVEEGVSSENRRAIDKRNGQRLSSSIRSPLAEASLSGRGSQNYSGSSMQRIQPNPMEASLSRNSAEAYGGTSTAPRFQDRPTSDTEMLPEGNSTFAESMLLVPVEPPSATSPRLLTPDDTPSPHQESTDVPAQDNSQQKLDLDTHAGTHQEDSVHFEAAVDSSMDMSHMRSSPPSMAPPRYNYATHLRQQRSLGPTETPSIIFSSPALPPLKSRPVAREQLPVIKEPSVALKSELTSSVRAGRVLQDIVVPFTSSTHSSNLRSPFKSPTERRHPLSPDEGSTKEQATQTPKPDSTVPGLGPTSWRNLTRSRTISGAAAHTHDARDVGPMKSIPVLVEDPFLPEGSAQLRSPSPEEKGCYALELPAQVQARNTHIVDLLAFETNTIRSGDEMGSQVEYPALRTPPQDPNEQSACSTTTVAAFGTATAQTEMQKEPYHDIWMEEPSASTTKPPATEPCQVFVAPSDRPTVPTTLEIQPQHTLQVSTAEDAYDDDDIWLAEARNSSSPPREKTRDAAPNHTILEKPKRSELPSPWTQNSKRLGYSDELAAHSSSPPRNTEVPARAQPNEARKTSPPATTGLAPKAVLLPKSTSSSSTVSQGATPRQLEPKAALLPKATVGVSAVAESSAQPQLAPKAVLLPMDTTKATALLRDVPQLGPLRQSNVLPKPTGPLFGKVRRLPQVHPFPQIDDVADLSNSWHIPQKQNFQPRITPRQSNILDMSALLAPTPKQVVESENLSAPVQNQEFVPVPIQRLPSTRPDEKVVQQPEEESSSQSDEASQVTSYDEATRDTHDHTSDVSVSDQDTTLQQSASVYDTSELSMNESFEESSRLSTTPARRTFSHRPPPASPLKSCIRTPSAASKAVVFSATTASSPSVAPLHVMGSDAEWEKSDWLSLRAIYWDYKKFPTPAAEIPQSVRDSEFTGKTVFGKDPDGSGDLVMEEWIMDIVHMWLEEAREKGEAWDEKFVCKRLYGLIVTERQRERKSLMEEREVWEREEARKEVEEMEERKRAKEERRRVKEEERMIKEEVSEEYEGEDMEYEYEDVYEDEEEEPAAKKGGILGLGIGWL